MAQPFSAVRLTILEAAGSKKLSAEPAEVVRGRREILGVLYALGGKFRSPLESRGTAVPHELTLPAARN